MVHLFWICAAASAVPEVRSWETTQAQLLEGLGSTSPAGQAVGPLSHTNRTAGACGALVVTRDRSGRCRFLGSFGCALVVTEPVIITGREPSFTSGGKLPLVLVLYPEASIRPLVPGQEQGLKVPPDMPRWSAPLVPVGNTNRD